jgi:hypothetical protein
MKTMKRILAVATVLPSVSFAAHPLVTDDTGTQGVGGFQLELSADRMRESNDGVTSRTALIASTLTYGLTDALDIAVAVPYQRISNDGEPRVRGMSDAALGMKWRFHEQDGLSIGLKPQVLIPTGNEQRGLGSGKAAYGMNLLASYEIDHCTFLANAGYTYSNNVLGTRKNIWNASAAVVWNALPKTRLLLDVGTYRNADPLRSRHPAFAVAGAIYSPHDKLDLDVGIRKGLNSEEADVVVGAGVTIRW